MIKAGTLVYLMSKRQKKSFIFCWKFDIWTRPLLTGWGKQQVLIQFDAVPALGERRAFNVLNTQLYLKTIRQLCFLPTQQSLLHLKKKRKKINKKKNY